MSRGAIGSRRLSEQSASTATAFATLLQAPANLVFAFFLQDFRGLHTKPDLSGRARAGDACRLQQLTVALLHVLLHGLYSTFHIPLNLLLLTGNNL